VVIAIIAILASMLMPALQKSRETAREANCKSNLKQFALATSMYCDNNGEYFMPSSQNVVNKNVWTWGYHFFEAKYLPGSNGIWKCPTARAMLQGPQFQKDFSKTAGMYPVNFLYVAYGYNNVTIGETPAGIKDPAGIHYKESLYPIKRSVIRKGATCLLFGETIDDAYNQGSADEGNYVIGNGGKTKHDRHNDGANVAWVDGHVSYLKNTMAVLKFDYAPKGYQNHYYQWR
ncbi:MAG: prepilin-type N-terminal cleavage/methylation domain-containing protein, partial [Lentisphaeria bacterium]|nr:prepilin-type N-terminal cleavage/methylation domain-containing protein [Lentisphaeria bacterium]